MTITNSTNSIGENKPNPYAALTVGGRRLQRIKQNGPISAAESAAFRKELVDFCGTTEDGARFLQQAVDPFHDAPFRHIGLPDAQSGKSVVQKIEKQFTIVRPASVASTAKWDSHIAFMPFLTSTSSGSTFTPIMTDTTNLCKDLFNGTASQPWTNILDCNMNMVTACSVPSGKPTFSHVLKADYDNATYQTIDTESLVSNANSSLQRVIAGAVKIQNVTEELHKSGAVCVYEKDAHKMTADQSRIFTDNGTSATYTKEIMCDRMQLPPATVGDCYLHGGITWEAKEGSIINCKIDAADNHATRFRSGNLILEGNSVPTEWNGTFSNARQGWGAAQPALNGDSSHCYLPILNIPGMQSGAYFTGLSPETVLNVTVRFYVEVFPFAENDLVTATGPSPSYDAQAIQCLSELHADMLPGHPDHMNGAGDFFRKVWRGVRKVGKDVIKPTLEAVALAAPNTKAGQAASTALKAEQFIEDARHAF